jgi:hypothetical protein
VQIHVQLDVCRCIFRFRFRFRFAASGSGSASCLQVRVQVHVRIRSVRSRFSLMSTGARSGSASCLQVHVQVQLQVRGFRFRFGFAASGAGCRPATVMHHGRNVRHCICAPSAAAADCLSPERCIRCAARPEPVPPQQFSSLTSGVERLAVCHAATPMLCHLLPANASLHLASFTSQMRESAALTVTIEAS